jgi:hypothetical protein
MRLFVSVFLIFISSLAFGQKSDFLKFENRLIELGTVNKGTVIDTAFTFINVSEEDVEIDIVDACECTTLDWTRGLIAPGKKGTIKVRFDSAKKDVVEEISVDITLMNTNPKTGGPVMDGVSYTYDFKLN